MIHPPCEIFYVESMLTATTSALQSVDNLNNCVKKLSPSKYQEIIDSAQNIINQSAILSRYFWPSPKSHKARGEYLRQKLSIQESNSLKNREIRNFIEHFDENLDIYCSTIIAGTIIPVYVGKNLKDATHVYFRAYFTDSGIFQVLGKTFVMQSIVEEIENLNHQLLYIKENGGRL